MNTPNFTSPPHLSTRSPWNPGDCFFTWEAQDDRLHRSPGPFPGGGARALVEPGADYLARLLPEDRQRLRELRGRLSPAMSTYRVCYDMQGPTGDLARVEEAGWGLFDDQNHLLRIQGSLTLQATTQTQVAQSLGERLLDSSLEGVCLWDPHSGAPSFLNPHYTRLTGYRLDDLRDMTPEQRRALYHPDQAGALAAHREALARAPDGALLEVEYRLMTAYGRWIWCLSRDSIHARDATGRVTQIIGTLLDISLQKQAEQALRESEDRFRGIFEQAAVGVAQIASPSGRFLGVNRKFCDILGYSRKEMLSGGLYDHLHPEDRHLEDDDPMARLLRGELRTLASERRYRHRNGATVWVNLILSVMGGERGEPDQCIAVMEDISARKKAAALLDTRLRLSTLAQGEGSLESLLQATLDAAEGLSDSQIGYFHFVEPDQENLSLQAWSTNTLATLCQAKPHSRHYPLSEAGVWVDCFYARSPVIHNEYASLPHRKGLPPGHAPVTRDLGVPVLRGDKVVAILGVGNKDADYTQEDARLLQELTYQVMDLVASRQAQEALQRSEELLTITLRSAELGAWHWNVRTGEVRFNDRWALMLGYPPGAIESHVRAWEKLLHPDDAPHVREALNAHLEGRTPFYRTEHRLRTQRGHWLWVLDSGQVYQRDPDGRPLLAAGVHIDITERKQAEQALRDSQADLNRAQAVGQIGSWRLDVRHNALRWSPQTHRLFGIPEGTPLTYEVFLERVHPEDRAYVDRQWQAALRGVPYDIEHRILVGEETKWVRERAELEHGPDGEVLGGFGTIQDITERKRTESFLRDADRRKDEFLAMLAHELRNPLVPIRNAAHIMGLLKPTDPTLQWAQAVIERQVLHLTHLVDDLLDVSRIVRGKIILRQEAITLDAVVRQALEIAQPLNESRHQPIEVHLPRQPLYLMGDPVRLAQVLLNLLDNAAKYSPDGSPITLEAERVGDEVCIQVRDQGAGIAPDLLPRVFDLFQQGERPADQAQGGLGIGLTLVRRLVEMHGGRVAAQSPGLGQGATFSLWLPVGEGPGIDPASPGFEPADPPAGTGLRVLVVDDDPSVAESTALWLELAGHQVRIAHSGLEALEGAAEFRPQVVLLDISLGGMDGYETARRLRQRPEGQTLFLVAMTGYGHEEARARSRAAGCDRHLVKPVDPQALADLLAGLSNNPRHA